MPKNIVVCCDGTGMEFGATNTNIVKLYEALEKKPSAQAAFYDPGVGTRSAPGMFTTAAKNLSRLAGLAFANGLIENVEDAYRYLMEQYDEGDKVYLFGFSRGAFTVRALAGLLHRCGLLQRGSENLIPYATKMYMRNAPKLAGDFKRTFARPCPVHFLGVWDTVKSVGLFRNPRFPNSALNPDVAHARHAISIDEARSHYRPNFISPAPGQDVRQVWFAGVHSDVGGGYKEAGLANISLHWMAREAANAGLLVDVTRLEAYPPDVKGKLHNPLVPFWWLLGWWRRYIPDKAKVHVSVQQRKEQLVDYHPLNLAEAHDVEYVD